MKGEKREKNILLISFIAGLVCAVAEFFFSIFSGSKSVLTDAVYDSSELIFIALIIFLTPLFYKPVSEKHPYGYYQLESIFLIIKGSLLLSVTVGVCVEVIQVALAGGNQVNEWNISIFQLCMAAGSVIIYFVIKKLNRPLSSPTVQVELMEWKLDIGYSCGLSAAFFASSFLKGTKLDFLIPYFDPVVAICVMAMMLPENLKMLIGAFKDVFLFSPDEETVDKIKEICSDVMEDEKICPMYVDVNRTGRHMWVSVYFDTESDFLTVKNLRRITDVLNRKVAASYANCSCELLLAPENDDNREENGSLKE